MYIFRISIHSASPSPRVLPFIILIMTLFSYVIDAGHGGKDIGTAGEYLYEKDATLTLAIELGEKLTKENENIEVKYTRTEDQFLPIHQRVAFANHNHADLFISIHCNAVKEDNPHGIETYVLGVQNTQDNLEIVKRENESILFEENFIANYDGFDPNSPSGHIYMSAVQNKYMNEGILIAHEIQTQFSDQKILRDRGVKQAGFVVLKNATMPSILLEVGFLSNQNDEIKLINDNSRSAIVRNISKGISKYVNSAQRSDNHIVAQENSSSLSHKPNKVTQTPQEFQKVTYDLVLASSAAGEISEMKDKNIKGMSVLASKKEGIYSYKIGPFYSLGEAINIQNELRKGEFKGAYVEKRKDLLDEELVRPDINIKFAGVNQ